MAANFVIPLQVMGTGIGISYAIAFLIKILLNVIRVFTQKSTKKM